jgi:hypothetical protein
MKTIVEVRYAGDEHELKIHSPSAIECPQNRKIKKTEIIVVELGAPELPNERRARCGTDLVWPVIRIIKPTDLRLHAMPHVCRHEIIAGD